MCRVLTQGIVKHKTYFHFLAKFVLQQVNKTRVNSKRWPEIINFTSDLHDKTRTNGKRWFNTLGASSSCPDDPFKASVHTDSAAQGLS